MNVSRVSDESDFLAQAEYKATIMNILKKLKQEMYMFRRLLLSFLFVGFFALRAIEVSAAELDNVRYTKLPGDQVQIDIEVNGAISDPGVFSTADPARIAFDFFGVSKRFSENLFKIGIGNVDSLVAVETDDRTRIIVNLLDTTPYSSQLTDSGYVITLEGPSFNNAQTVASSDSPVVSTGAFSYQPEMVSSKYVNTVDFRRNSNGGGKVVVALSDPSVSVNVKDQANKIRLDFSNSSLVPGLEKRLDVVDFATPVDSIDVFQNGPNVSMVVDTNKKYRQISYQSGNQFTLIIDPFVETEAEKSAREAEENKYTGDRLSINFQKIEVRAALAVISDFTGINIVTSDDVEGELTLNLKDVPWDQALDVILQTKGLDKRLNGDVIYVAPAKKLAENEAAKKAAQEALAEVAPLVSEVIKVNFAQASELREVLLGDSEEGGEKDDNVSTVINLGGGEEENAVSSESNKATLQITADDRSNSLIITTTAENLENIKQLIKKLDSPLRQVMIETRIVEATDTFSRSLGAKLGFQRLTDNAQLPGGSTLATRSIIGATNTSNTTLSNSLVDDEPGIIFEQGGLGQNVDLGADPIDGERAASYALQLFKAGRGYANLISLELSALEADGQGKIVASPRLVAADNNEANIRQGQIRLFTVAGTGLGGSGTTTVEREAVLGLTVVPKITPDDRVVLDVSITQDFFITEDLISTKAVNTQVLVDNGETIIIGGIYQESESSSVSKVPVLGDVPYLGNLFKKKTVADTRTETIIFLTPKIINESLRLR